MNKGYLKLAVIEEGDDLLEMRDDDLMRLMKADHKPAFETIYRRYRDFVLGMACRYTGSQNAGRDVTQDVFLSLWSERERYSPKGKFRSYLVSVVLHRCHHLARQSKSHKIKNERFELDQTAINEPQGPAEELLRREQAREARALLTSLPPKLREVMILRFTSGFSLQEIANVTGLPLGTVKVRVFRGLKKLHQKSGEARR